MAPNKGSSAKSSKAKASPKLSRLNAKSRGSSTPAKSRSTKGPPLPPPKQQKTKSFGPIRRKRKVYTDKELGLPQLNMITPAGVQKPRGKKKGKVFVDDVESMATILALVNAEKEGQIESKMIRSRQLEEIREARKKEAEAKAERRKGKLEDTKDVIRKKRKRGGEEAPADNTESESKPAKPYKSRKRVSFG